MLLRVSNINATETKIIMENYRNKKIDVGIKAKQ